MENGNNETASIEAIPQQLNAQHPDSNTESLKSEISAITEKIPNGECFFRLNLMDDVLSQGFSNW